MKTITSVLNFSTQIVTTAQTLVLQLDTDCHYYSDTSPTPCPIRLCHTQIVTTTQTLVLQLVLSDSLSYTDCHYYSDTSPTACLIRLSVIHRLSLLLRHQSYSLSYQTLCHTQIVTTTRTLVLQLVLSVSLSYTDCHYYSDTSPTACPIRLSVIHRLSLLPRHQSYSLSYQSLCHTQIVTTTQTLVLQLVLSVSLSYTDCHYYSDTNPTACPIRISVIHRLSLLLRHQSYSLSYQSLCHTQIVTTTQTLILQLVLSESLSYTDCHYYSDTCPIRLSVIHRLSLLLRHQSHSLSYQTLCHTQIVTTTQTLVPHLVLSDSLSYTDCHYYSDTSPTACPIRLSVIHRLSLLLRHQSYSLSYQTLCHTQIVTTTQTLVLQLVLSDSLSYTDCHYYSDTSPTACPIRLSVIHRLSLLLRHQSYSLSYQTLSYTDCHYYSDTSPTACPIRLCHTQIVTTTQTLVPQLVLSESLSYTDCHYYSDTCPIRLSVIHRLSLLLRHQSYSLSYQTLSYTDCHYYSDTSPTACPIRLSVIHSLSYQTLCHTQIVTTTQTLVLQLVLSDSLSYTDCHYYSDTSPTACPIRLSVIHRLSLLLRHQSYSLSYQSLCHTQIVTTTQTLVPQLVLSDSLSYTDCHYYSDTSPTPCPIRLSVIHRLSLLLRHQSYSLSYQTLCHTQIVTTTQTLVLQLVLSDSLSYTDCHYYSDTSPTPCPIRLCHTQIITTAQTLVLQLVLSDSVIHRLSLLPRHQSYSLSYQTLSYTACPIRLSVIHSLSYQTLCHTQIVTTTQTLVLQLVLSVSLSYTDCHYYSDTSPTACPIRISVIHRLSLLLRHLSYQTLCHTQIVTTTQTLVPQLVLSDSLSYTDCHYYSDTSPTPCPIRLSVIHRLSLLLRHQSHSLSYQTLCHTQIVTTTQTLVPHLVLSESLSYTDCHYYSDTSPTACPIRLSVIHRLSLLLRHQSYSLSYQTLCHTQIVTTTQTLVLQLVLSDSLSYTDCHYCSDAGPTPCPIRLCHTQIVTTTQTLVLQLVLSDSLSYTDCHYYSDTSSTACPIRLSVIHRLSLLLRHQSYSLSYQTLCHTQIVTTTQTLVLQLVLSDSVIHRLSLLLRHQSHSLSYQTLSYTACPIRLSVIHRLSLLLRHQSYSLSYQTLCHTQIVTTTQTLVLQLVLSVSLSYTDCHYYSDTSPTACPIRISVIHRLSLLLRHLSYQTLCHTQIVTTTQTLVPQLVLSDSLSYTDCHYYSDTSPTPCPIRLSVIHRLSLLLRHQSYSLSYQTLCHTQIVTTTQTLVLQLVLSDSLSYTDCHYYSDTSPTACPIRLSVIHRLSLLLRRQSYTLSYQTLSYTDCHYYSDTCPTACPIRLSVIHRLSLLLRHQFYSLSYQTLCHTQIVTTTQTLVLQLVLSDSLSYTDCHYYSDTSPTACPIRLSVIHRLSLLLRRQSYTLSYQTLSYTDCHYYSDTCPTACPIRLSVIHRLSLLLRHQFYSLSYQTLCHTQIVTTTQTLVLQLVLSDSLSYTDCHYYSDTSPTACPIRLCHTQIVTTTQTLVPQLVLSESLSYTDCHYYSDTNPTACPIRLSVIHRLSYQNLCHTQIVTTTQTLVPQIVLSESLSYTDCHYYSDTSPTACPIRLSVIHRLSLLLRHQSHSLSYQNLCHTQIVTTTQTLILQLVLSDSLSYTACPIRISVIHRLSLLLRHQSHSLSYQTLCHTQIVTTTQTLVLQLVLSDSLSYTDCHYYSDTSPTACPIRLSVIHRLSLLLRHQSYSLSYQTLCHTQIVTTTQTLVPQLVLSDSLSYTDCHYYSDTSPTPCPIRLSVIHRLSLLLRH